MRSPGVPPSNTVETLESRLHLSGTHFVHKTASLSQARFFPAATTVGSQAIIAGGRLDNAGESDAVDIYNATTARWSAAQLSESRHQIGATSVGKKALFAGGDIGILGSDTVDVYDSANGQWSAAKLSQANTPSASVTIGDKALFIGGQPLNTSRVEIYDAAKDRWSTAELSEARFYPVGTAVGGKAIFAGGGFADGGFSDAVDIYDAAKNQWTTTKLPVPAQFAVATTVNGKALFAGGLALNKHGNEVDSGLVEIYDVKSGRWSTARLSQARGDFAVGSTGSVAFFAGGEYTTRNGRRATNVVDVFDAQTGEWTTTTLAQARAGLTGTTVGQTVIFAAGFDPTDFVNSARASVDLFTLDSIPPTSALISAPTINHSIKTYTFTVSYHDRNGIDRSTFDNNDTFVTGPNGFNHSAQFVSQTRGKHGSTRVVRYAVRGRGLHWDSTENGIYTIRLHSAQISDVAGNPAVGRRIGPFTVAIPTPPQSSSLPTAPVVASPFQAKRNIDDLLET